MPWISSMQEVKEEKKEKGILAYSTILPKKS
jgi:hypothetical protein